MEITKQIWVGTFIKKEFVSLVKAKAVVEERLFAIKKGRRIIFIHGFSKNEKSNLSPKELFVFKELAKILLSFSESEIDIAVQNGDLKEVAT